MHAQPARRATSASRTRAGRRTARRTRCNAHPHTDCTGTIAVVHNGIIENYGALKTMLQKQGPQVHHRDRHRSAGAPRSRSRDATGKLEEAVIDGAARCVEGTYGIAVISRKRAGQDRRRAQGQPAARSASATTSTSSRPTSRAIVAAHAPGRLPRRRRDGGADAATATNAATSTRRAVDEGGEPHRLGPRRRSRRAATSTSCSRRSSSSRTTMRNSMRGRLVAEEGLVEARRPEPDDGGAARARPASSSRRAARLARGADRRVHDRGASRASRSRSSTRPSSATATRSSTTGRCASSITQSGETADTLAAMREAKRTRRADARAS